MIIHNINDLYEKQKKIWKEENELYFGITPLSNWNNQKEVAEHLNKCADLLWNNGTNELKILLENGKCNDIDKLKKGSYELVYDQYGIVCLYATFQYNQERSDGGFDEIVKRAPLAYLPVPDDLCWYFGDSRYVLRITAISNYSLIYRMGRNCYYQKAWVYNLDEGEFHINLEGFDPWINMTDLNKEWMSYWCNADETKNFKIDENKLTYENFIQAMNNLPEYDPCAIYNFKFTHVDEMFNLIKRSKRFANPIMKVSIPINIVKMFTAQRVRSDAVDRNGSNNLVLASNDLFALENARTVIYKNEFNNSFMFTSSERFFDAFKTSTNKSAGKSRLLLDDVEVKDGKLWNIISTLESEGLKNMWEIATHPEWNISKNLSVLSSSNFSSNNAPKRIMMTAKLRAQAVKTAGENDPFTHETLARIVFGDWKGFNYGDGIIISRSFARKLRSRKVKKIHINDKEIFRELKQKYKIGDFMHVSDLFKLTNSTMYNNYRNILIESLSNEWIIIEADLPFSVGDKLTNLHGSKGVVSLILEDEDMPYIKEDIGNFPAGPFDIIISGLSVYRRKSLGQIFEAWSKATGHEDVDNILDAVKKYSAEMKDFSEKSVVFFQNYGGVKKPIGINAILRLDHDACGKQSHSYIKSNYARMLKFGEMELLNLASRGLFNIMNEIDIRSISKHHNALDQIQDMQRNGNINNEAANSLRFFNILRTIGFDFNLRSLNQMDKKLTEFMRLQRLLTDEQIDLF